VVNSSIVRSFLLEFSWFRFEFNEGDVMPALCLGSFKVLAAVACCKFKELEKGGYRSDFGWFNRLLVYGGLLGSGLLVGTGFELTSLFCISFLMYY
jgi:hypothetical protein